jgi:cyclin-dependent kinase-like
MRLALREIRLLKASQHENVVQLLEAFRSKSGRVYIVMVNRGKGNHEASAQWAEVVFPW